MTFSQKLALALDQGLGDALGEQAAKSISFFIDPRIALKDPNKYWSNLDKMFNHNSNMLKSKLIASIGQQFNLGGAAFSDLGTCVKAAKEQFLKDDLAERSD